MQLVETKIGQVVSVRRVEGERSFRRRLLELGLVPGTRIEVVGVAPLGDPIELLVRGSSLSIRRQEAELVTVDNVQVTSEEQFAAELDTAEPAARSVAP